MSKELEKAVKSIKAWKEDNVDIIYNINLPKGMKLLRHKQLYYPLRRGDINEDYINYVQFNREMELNNENNN